MLELEFVPDIHRLTTIFSQATAPTFFLGAIAGFVSLMNVRLTDVMGRIRALNAIRDDDPDRAHLKADLIRLRRRAHYLSDGIHTALIGGLCATGLLAVLFMSEFVGLKYAYGAGMLFFVATVLMGKALYRFAQEARLGISETDEHG